LTASDYGKSVIILEKMPVIGGNSLLSTGLINAPDPERQKLVGIDDSNDLFFKQTYDAGPKTGNQNL
jgi:urocanate reductase